MMQTTATALGVGLGLPIHPIHLCPRFLVAVGSRAAAEGKGSQASQFGRDTESGFWHDHLLAELGI